MSVTHFNAFSAFAKYLRKIPGKYPLRATLPTSAQEISSPLHLPMEDLSEPTTGKLFSQIDSGGAAFLPSNCLDLLEREFLMAAILRSGVAGGAR